MKEFSGGMKRRLEIARGLLHRPKIIFLDEPTLGLDPQTRNHIWSYIKKLNKDEGITVFFTTHYMDEAARVANRVLPAAFIEPCLGLLAPAEHRPAVEGDLLRLFEDLHGMVPVLIHAGFFTRFSEPPQHRG